MRDIGARGGMIGVCDWTHTRVWRQLDEVEGLTCVPSQDYNQERLNA